MANSNTNFGYGKDIGLKFNEYGEIDLSIDSTGDLSIVGGDGNQNLKVRVENAIQQIRLRLMTPMGSLKDENNNSLDIGSLVYTMIGQKKSDMNLLLFKSYVLSAIYDLPFIDSVIDIQLLESVVNEKHYYRTKIFFKLKNDANIYFDTINLTNS